MADKLLSDNDLMRCEPNAERLSSAYDLLSHDITRGLAELETLASEGSVMAMLYLGEAHRRHRIDEAKGQKWYEAAYARGSATGMYRLGRLHLERKNYAEAERIFLDGASRGDGASMYWLAMLYLVDPRHAPKVAESEALFERAIAKGQVFAKRNFGRLLLRGQHGMKRNLLKGFLLYSCGTVEAIKLRNTDPYSPRLR